jgi:hypothetical protein
MSYSDFTIETLKEQLYIEMIEDCALFSQTSKGVVPNIIN